MLNDCVLITALITKLCTAGLHNYWWFIFLIMHVNIWHATCAVMVENIDLQQYYDGIYKF